MADAYSLSPRDQQAVEYIHAYIAKHGYGPSIREVGTHLGYAHPNNAKKVIDRLNAGGLLNLNRPGGVGAPRTLKITNPGVTTRGADIEIPIIGNVGCGPGQELLEENGERLNLREMFGRDDLAAYRASGNSMIDEHIVHGDLLIVRRSDVAENGEIIVAMLDRGMLCKRYRLVNRLRDGFAQTVVRLESRNDAMKPIEFEIGEMKSFRILGIFYSLIRNH